MCPPFKKSGYGPASYPCDYYNKDWTGTAKNDDVVTPTVVEL
jgi:hypothetical protein